MTEQETVIAICHVLREMGYRKESDQYYVKKEGEPWKCKGMSLRNVWGLKHYDWNSIGHKLSSPTEGEKLYGVGYVCSVPTYNQLRDFAISNGIELANIKDHKIILRDLIEHYRKTRKKDKAFEKYITSLNALPKERKVIGGKVKGYVYDAYIVPAIEKMNAMELLANMPNGRNTPQSIYFQMYPHGEDWSLTIRDWFGDRSTIEICSIKTSQCINLEAAIRFLFRDMMHFLMARYPDEEYTCNMLKWIIDKNPQLKTYKFYTSCTEIVNNGN